MCTQYLTWQDAASFEILPYSHTGKPTAQIRPQDCAPVFIQEEKSIVSRVMRWGFPLQRGALLSGAQAETVQEKPLFHSAFLYRRCALPVLGFYEGNAQGERFVMTEKEKNLLYMAGLWQSIGGEDRFVVLTAPQTQREAFTPPRIPLLLYADQTIRWLESLEEAQRLCRQGSGAKLSALALKLRA